MFRFVRVSLGLALLLKAVRFSQWMCLNKNHNDFRSSIFNHFLCCMFFLYFVFCMLLFSFLLFASSFSHFSDFFSSFLHPSTEKVEKSYFLYFLLITNSRKKHLHTESCTNTQTQIFETSSFSHFENSLLDRFLLHSLGPLRLCAWRFLGKYWENSANFDIFRPICTLNCRESDALLSMAQHVCSEIMRNQITTRHFTHKFLWIFLLGHFTESASRHS